MDEVEGLADGEPPAQSPTPAIRILLYDGQQITGRLHHRWQGSTGSWFYHVSVTLWASTQLGARDVPEPADGHDCRTSRPGGKVTEAQALQSVTVGGGWWRASCPEHARPTRTRKLRSASSKKHLRQGFDAGSSANRSGLPYVGRLHSSSGRPVSHPVRPANAARSKAGRDVTGE